MHTATACPVIVIAVGSYGDIFPYLKLAQTFQARGHEVSFIASSYHRSLAEQAGLAFFGLGNDEDYLRILNNPDLWNPRKGFSLLASFYPELIAEILKTTQAVLKSCDTRVLCHPLALPAAAILREQGLIGQIVTAFLAPSNIPSCYGRLQIEDFVLPDFVGARWRRYLWRLIEKRYIDKVALVKINQVRSKYQLAAIRTYFGHMLATPDAALCLFPAWFGKLQPDWPKTLLQADFPLFDGSAQTEFSPELQTFLKAGSRPLIFTPGTGHRHAQKFFELATQVVEQHGWRAIFLTKEKAQLPANLSANIIWQEYVPLRQLLPHAALLAHHGGIGTSAEAMRAAVPQLITPYAWDQFDNGGRMQELGIARSIPAKKLNLATMSAALRALLNSAQVQQSCLSVAANFADSESAASMCERLESALSSRQSGVC